MIDLGLRSWAESLHPRDWHGRFASSSGGGGGVPSSAIVKRVGKLQKALDATTPTDKDPALYDPVTKSWAGHRQVKHAAIVRDILDKSGSTPSQGRAIMAGGLGGSGKSTVLGKHLGVKKNDYVTINPDDIKEEMARRGMVPVLPSMTPMESAFLIHEESSHISGLLAKAALARRKNVIFDRTMASAGSTSNILDSLQSAGYTHVAGVFVDIPVEESVARAMARYERGLGDHAAGKGFGGRFVPPDIIRASAVEGASSQNRQTFDSMEHQFTGTALFDNSGVAPVQISRRGSIT